MPCGTQYTYAQPYLSATKNKLFNACRKMCYRRHIERNSWGKSGCEWMCCFPNTGGLHHTSGDEIHNLIHHNPWQPIANCRMCAKRSVIEDAVENNSWGKSECEWICCIPNTKRLYSTSIDASLETHNLTHNTTWQPRSN